MSVDHQQVTDALPNYEVGDEIGRGGWGVVLSGRHRHLGREVAIKQLPPSFATDAAVRARFVAEARALASLDHPHVVPIYDYVEQDGLCLLVMEMLPGGTVWSRFNASGFTPPAACAVALAGSSGLHAAHLRNILHRDVKPENFMFSGSGALKVTDFGIAKVVSGEETLATRAGEVLGTPAYIAPEQARGGTLSPATDIYALSTMLYELLSGSLPFEDDADGMALMFKHAFEEPTPLTEKAPVVPEAVAAVVMRGLATDPEDRYPSAEAFALALAEACTSVWGAGWLAAEKVPVLGASSVVAVTERMTDPMPEPATTPVKPAQSAAEGPAAPPTATVGAVEDGARATVRPASGAIVRPSVALHPRGAALADLAEAELVPLKEVVKAPPTPRVPLLIGAGLFVLSLLIAFIGFGSPGLGGNLPKGDVTVAGVDPTSGSVVSLDLAKPVAVDLAQGAPSADHVRLSLFVLGIDVSDAGAALAPAGSAQAGSTQAASVDASGVKYLAAGRMTARVELLRSNSVVASWRFAARTTQPSILSVGGAIVIVLLLFAGAYGESFLRSLRRGRRKVSSSGGLGLMGLLVGVAFVGVAWLAAGRQPEVATLVVCAVLGAGAGAAVAVGGTRIGQLRRFRRVQRKQRAT